MSVADQRAVQKWATLVKLLDSLTDSRKLKWDSGSQDNSYITAVGSQVIQLSKVYDRNNSNVIIRIEINDEFGNTIDQFSDEDLTADLTFSPFTFMMDLYRKAARQSSGADAVLDAILSKLQEEDDNPF